MNKIIKKIKSIPLRIKIKLREKRFKGKLPYLFYDNHSDSIMIVFSAFTGNKRRYNYVKGLRNLKMDRLYILDPFGYQGSYNLLEGGRDFPECLTRGLIEYVLAQKHYNHIFTAGSSKGGTCAIYFGLEYHAEDIFSGACQYNLGSYLHRPDHEKIFKAMIGEGDTEMWSERLNRIMPTLLEKHQLADSCVHVVYSKKELTYQRQIVDLINKLQECKIPMKDVDLQFDNHEDVGIPFLQYVLKQFSW